MCVYIYVYTQSLIRKRDSTGPFRLEHQPPPETEGCEVCCLPRGKPCKCLFWSVVWTGLARSIPTLESS